MLNNSEKLNKIEILQNPTISIDKKNEIALLLSDYAYEDDSVLEVLHDLILDEKYVNKRGTFVHCLRAFAPEKSFILAIDLILTANFEVAHEAFEIINNCTEINGDDAIITYDKLKKYDTKNSLDESWRKELIADVLAMFI